MDFLTNAYNIALIIFGFGFLIFIHELGHFFAAKWAGVRTEAFAVGMGHVVCAWRKGIGFTFGSTHRRVVTKTGKSAAELTDAELAEHNLGETEYSLRWLPIGGFVKMLGQDDANPAAVSNDPRSFNVCSIPKRMVIISAGVIMNVLLAAVLFIVAFMVGVRFEAPVVGDVSSTLPAGTTQARNSELVGLQPGDRVIAIDGEPAATFADIQIASAMSRPDQYLELTIERDGLDQPLIFDLLPEKDSSTGMFSIGVTPGVSATLMKADHKGALRRELDRIGLSRAGVKPGMTLVEVEGQTITSYEQFARIAKASNGSSLHTVWSSFNENGSAEGEKVNATVAVQPTLALQRYPERDESRSVDFESGLLGLIPLVRVDRFSPDSPNEGILQIGDAVLRVGDLDTPRIANFYRFVHDHPGESVEMVVLRDKQEINLTVHISRKGKLGVYPGYALDSPRFARPLNRVLRQTDKEPSPTPVSGLDLQGGSRFVSVGDVAVSNWLEFREALRRQTLEANETHKSTTVSVTFADLTAESTPASHDLTLSPADLAELHALGWRSDLDSYLFAPVYTVLSAEGSPLRAVSMGLHETKKIIVLTYLTIDRLFRGTVGVEQLRGPVGIVHIGTKIANRGMMYLIFFLAMISVNLAVINFLPLPIVDGGLFLFLIYEKLKGRPPSIAFQNAATILGLVLIGAIFLITFYNDVMRLIT